MKQKFCVLFAGAIGSSKSPIANYLSSCLGIPVFSNDVLRTEVVEDYGFLDEKKFALLRKKRLEDIFLKGNSFILDASIDRVWEKQNFRKMIEEYDYEWFIISLDLSEDFLKRLYGVKQYKDVESLLRTKKDHDVFLEKYNEIIELHILEKDFKDRLSLSLKAVEHWIKSN